MNGEIIFNSFTLVAMSEMGDKTQLLAFSLASRFRKPWIILSGILTATLVNHAIAAEMGSLFSEWLSEKWPSFFLPLHFGLLSRILMKLLLKIKRIMELFFQPYSCFF